MLSFPLLWIILLLQLIGEAGSGVPTHCPLEILFSHFCRVSWGQPHHLLMELGKTLFSNNKEPFPVWENNADVDRPANWLMMRQTFLCPYTFQSNKGGGTARFLKRTPYENQQPKKKKRVFWPLCSPLTFAKSWEFEGPNWVSNCAPPPGFCWLAAFFGLLPR